MIGRHVFIAGVIDSEEVCRKSICLKLDGEHLQCNQGSYAFASDRPHGEVAARFRAHDGVRGRLALLGRHIPFDSANLLQCRFARIGLFDRSSDEAIPALRAEAQMLKTSGSSPIPAFESRYGTSNGMTIALCVVALVCGGRSSSSSKKVAGTLTRQSR